MIAQLDTDRKGLERFLPQLRECGAQELERRGRGRRTLPLFHGTLTYRMVPATLRVADEAAALNHAVQIAAIKVDTSTYRAAALEARKQTGELLRLRSRPGKQSFSIRFGKPGLGEAGEE